MIIWAEDAPSVVNFGCYQRQNQKIVIGKENARITGGGTEQQPGIVDGKKNARTHGVGKRIRVRVGLTIEAPFVIDKHTL
jgi:hypothetical protein